MFIIGNENFPGDFVLFTDHAVVIQEDLLIEEEEINANIFLENLMTVEDDHFACQENQRFVSTHS